jgi:tetratricopeptide (TPR) repeat protein
MQPSLGFNAASLRASPVGAKNARGLGAITLRAMQKTRNRIAPKLVLSIIGALAAAVPTPAPLRALCTVSPYRACTRLTASSAWQAQQRFRPKAQEATEAGGDRTIDGARAGMKMLMNGSPDEAIKTFQQIQQDDPESAVGYLLEADATWWKIYLTIGNLVDPDVFDVANTQKSAYDARFEEILNVAIRKAEASIHAQRDVARNYLYEGLGYGLRARFTGLRDSDLPTARAGKKMRSLLLQAVATQPNLNDAYLGLGIYNYFVDTLPTLVKLLKFLIGLPGGSRDLGLQQLETAANKGDLVRSEAKFYLAKDYSRGTEQQYAKSLQLFQELELEYPENMLWKLLVGSLEIRLGRVDEGESRYRAVLSRTQGAVSDVDQALHREAIKAIARRHPGEHLE